MNQIQPSDRASVNTQFADRRNKEKNSDGDCGQWSEFWREANRKGSIDIGLCALSTDTYVKERRAVTLRKYEDTITAVYNLPPNKFFADFALRCNTQQHKQIGDRRLRGS